MSEESGAANIQQRVDEVRSVRACRARLVAALSAVMLENAGGRPKWDRARLDPRERARALAQFDAYERAVTLLHYATKTTGYPHADFLERVHDAVGHIPSPAIVAAMEYASLCEDLRGLAHARRAPGQ